MKLKKTAAIIFAVVFISGCSTVKSEVPAISRTFNGKELIPHEMHRTCIEEIINNSSKDEIPELLISELRKKINEEGRLTLTTDINSCEIKLRLKLLPLKTDVQTFNSAGIPEKKKLRLDARVTLVHAITGEEVIKNREVYAEFIYSETGAGSISEFRGITGLTERLAGRILSVITTGWFKEDYRKNVRGEY